jgi:hypothetical protein
MRAYVIAIAVILTSAGPAIAEPAKDEAAKSAQQQQCGPIVLASADPVAALATQSQQPVPTVAKRRIAPRVTTCRCGDPQVSADNPEQ